MCLCMEIYNSFSISLAMSMGSVVGAYRLIGMPSLFTRNLVKFHLMPLPKVPDCLAFKYLYKGAALSPFTSIYKQKKRQLPYFNLYLYLNIPWQRLRQYLL